MPDGRSGDAPASDSGPAWAASIADLLRYSVRQIKRRNRHSLRRCRECQREDDSDQPDHSSLAYIPQEIFQKLRTYLMLLPLHEHQLNNIVSMGRRGNPYDNAKAEGFMNALKVDAGWQRAARGETRRSSVRARQ